MLGKGIYLGESTFFKDTTWNRSIWLNSGDSVDVIEKSPYDNREAKVYLKIRKKEHDIMLPEYMVRMEHFTNTNKTDEYCKDILHKILGTGAWDINPRPHWEDGAPAHSLSINGAMTQYDLSKGEIPLLTLRPVVYKKAISELLWIYKDASNDLKRLREVYGIHWWDDWALEDDTIGACYGETVRRHNLMHNLIDGIEKNPDSRYHIINLWQVEDFKDPHGLKPCCFQTNFNVRHKDNETFLDMTLYQRSTDFMTAGITVNEIQYAVFLCVVAHHFGYTPGIYTHFMQNIQIYDRHIKQAHELLSRETVPCEPKIWINPNKKDFFSLEPDDIKIIGYDVEIIKEINPQLKFPLAI